MHLRQNMHHTSKYVIKRKIKFGLKINVVISNPHISAYSQCEHENVYDYSHYSKPKTKQITRSLYTTLKK